MDQNASSAMTVATQLDVEPSTFAFLDGKRANYYVAIGVVLFVAWLLQLARPSKNIDAPFYKASKWKWIFDAETQINKSYRKYYGQAYQIRATEGLQVLVPANVVGELKTLPDDVLSATEAVTEALQSKYTKFTPGHNADLLALLVRTRLTQNLVRLIPELKGELEYIVGTEFPACDDWTAVKWQPFSLRAIARLSGRAFVGPSLNRDERWMDISINYAIHVFMACIKLQFFPKWARPVGQFLVTDLGKINRDMKGARELLKPLLEERLRDMDTPGAEDSQPQDLTQWLIGALPPEEKADVHIHAELQLILSAASIHTTNGLLCECMFDLAANPEAQEELRLEAYQVLEVEQGWARKESMAKLKKMDSFMREVQRMRGNITSFIRKVMKPISLSDGTELPAGTKVLAPLAGFSRDERFFESPDTFDALRFYRMRQESEEASNRWQFTSLSDTNLHFGAGRHACPGRFFAGNEIKVVLAHFLINYDIRLKEGEKRPEPLAMVMTKAPKPDAELEFRRRTLTA